MTGSRQEAVLRVVPILATALSAGLVTWSLGRRLGWVAGAAAGVVVGCHPLVLDTGREVRGYSLLLLCSVVSTILLVRLLEDGEPASAALVVGYVVAVAAGIATHLFMLGVVVVHAAAVGIDAASLRRWVPRWVAAVVLGVAPLPFVLWRMVHADRGRVFQGDFPVTLAQDLLGGSRWAVALLVPLVVVAAWCVRRSPVAWRVALAVAVLLTGAWLVAPRDLYPRFFVWLVPVVAGATAVAVARWRPLALVVVAFAAVELVQQVPDMGRDALSNRTAAAIAEQVSARGGTVCALALSDGPLSAYTDAFERVRDDPARLHGCDVALVVDAGSEEQAAVIERAGRTFEHEAVLAAEEPGRVLSHRPLRCWTGPDGC